MLQTYPAKACIVAFLTHFADLSSWVSALDNKITGHYYKFLKGSQCYYVPIPGVWSEVAASHAEAGRGWSSGAFV